MKNVWHRNKTNAKVRNCTLKYLARWKAKNKMQKMALNQLWQGWPQKDPKQFWFPLGSHNYSQKFISKNFYVAFGYQFTAALAWETFKKKWRLPWFS